MAAELSRVQSKVQFRCPERERQTENKVTWRMMATGRSREREITIGQKESVLEEALVVVVVIVEE